ncbi:MAG: S41 family peptidase [Myxococcota bacterium]
MPLLLAKTTALISMSVAIVLGVLAMGEPSDASSATPSTVSATREQPRRPATPPQRLTKEQAAEDLFDWQRRLYEVHPDPERRLTKDELSAEIDEAIGHFPASMSRSVFYVMAAGLAARLGDSHTTLLHPEELASIRLPLLVEDGELCLTSPVGDLPAGSCLQRVGRYPSSKIVPWARRLVSAETQVGLDRGVPRALPALGLALGLGSPWSIEGTTPNGDVVRAHLGLSDNPPPKMAAMELHMMPGSIAVLTVRTFAAEYGRTLLDAFDEHFEWLERQPVRGLVVDLRNNDGGSTIVADALLGHITQRPYRMLAMKHWKVSEPMREHLRELGPASSAYFDAEIGDDLLQQIQPTPPAKARHRFDGPVAFLIGPGTLSAAMMLADAIHEYELGLLVGEPTSSPPTYFGEIYTYAMPHSGLTATISSAAFLRASGDPRQPGPVEPHLRVDERLADTIAGRDPTLETALEALRSDDAAPQLDGAGYRDGVLALR